MRSSSFMTGEWLLLTVIGFAKLFATSALYIVYLMSSEVLPTPVRTSGTGVFVVFGMIGMAVSPHVLHVRSIKCLVMYKTLTYVYIKQQMKPAYFVLQYGADGASHYWILLALTIASAACMIPMPETIGLQLPQTFQDAEDLGAGRPITSWVHHWNLHKFMAEKEPQSDTLSKDLLTKPN